MDHHGSPQEAVVDVSKTWQILGPFQIGTREATWGADPLENIGGFRSLHVDADRSFPSSLGLNGKVGWTEQPVVNRRQTVDTVETSLVVAFPDIDWTSLQSFYGWAALQWQAWARGQLIITGKPQTIVLYIDSVLEYWIDDEHYFGGDFYAFRRAPLVIVLTPGVHRLDIRLVRDVRAMGGTGDPDIRVDIKLVVSRDHLAVIAEKALVPEIVEDRGLAGGFGSVPVRNEGHCAIHILAIKSLDDTIAVSFLKDFPTNLFPGQSRPLCFRMNTNNFEARAVSFVITWATENALEVPQSQKFSVELTKQKFHDPHRMTFLHPSGIVSYAILRAPTRNLNQEDSHVPSLPVLLNLHGAGLEADSELARHTLDSVSNVSAWTLSPTGVTTWSGDDWHVWGFADVEAAIAAIPEWMATTSWNGPRVTMNEWYVCGHSNGGQGTWYALTHRSDKIRGAAPVSGYSSIQGYVPYQFWHEADPRISSLVATSLVNYRHELLMVNIAGIPLQQQHGDNDYNVPVFHSRRLYQLLHETGSLPQYAELSGQGHWFDGIMTTRPLRTFYDRISAGNTSNVFLPKQFSIVVPPSGNVGSRGGIVVDQLISPDQVGRIVIDRDDHESIWTLKTSNIHRFHISSDDYSGDLPASIDVDGAKFSIDIGVDRLNGSWLSRDQASKWMLSKDRSWQSIEERYGSQIGALDALLRSRGTIIIRSTTSACEPMASQIARNLFQYFGADSEISKDTTLLPDGPGNVISLHHGALKMSSVPKSSHITHPITLSTEGLSLRDVNGRQAVYNLEKGLGAIYLSPLSDARLEMIIWGNDLEGLRLASRLVPMMTGVGQPDFIIVKKECTWKGAAGVLAMGFFDHAWNISRASFLT